MAMIHIAIFLHDDEWYLFNCIPISDVFPISFALTVYECINKCLNFYLVNSICINNSNFE